MTRPFALASFALLLPITAALAQQEPTRIPAADTPTPTVLEDPELVQQYQATITAEDLAAHLYFFASDFFEGRETTAPGQKMAAYYLASQYRRTGVLPKGTGGTGDPNDPNRYLQPFPLYESKFQMSNLSVSGPDGLQVSSTFGLDGTDKKSYLRMGSAGTYDGEVLFAGYGIADTELGYSDYEALEAAGIDQSGKWILILDGAPSFLNDPVDGPSVWSSQWWRKLQTARQFGAKGLIVIGSPDQSESNPFGEVALRQLRARSGVGSLSLEATDQGGRRLPPTFHVEKTFADQILKSTKQTTASIADLIETSGKPYVQELPGFQVVGEVVSSQREVETENVVAIIEGADPELKNEVVIVSSHYDHVGMNLLAEGDQIYNGADDDGSGTVAILEIAEAFMQASRDGFGPRRSIVFLNVTGEEKGLLGSSWFTDNEPLVPLENVVANLNIDMIGRFDPTHPSGSENYVYIIGSNLISQELHDLNLKINDITGTSLELDERFNSKDDPNQFYRRSDHWNFGKNNIPFIFFFTGTHEDYHGLDDEADKVEYERMTRITRLIFATAWQVANQDERPAVSGEGFN